jgi:hypothetical protein
MIGPERCGGADRHRAFTELDPDRGRRVGVHLRRAVALGCTATLLTGTAALFTAGDSGPAGDVAAEAPVVEPVDAGAVAGDLLLPGGPAGVVRITLRNPNPHPVRLVNVRAGVPPVTATGGKGACAGPEVSFTGGTIPPDSVVGAGARRTIDLPGAARMAATAGDGCQGARFRIPVTVTVVAA